MATLGQVVYDIREALKDYSDDSELDNRYIIYLVNLKRAKYIKQKLEKFGRRFNNKVLQSLCLDLETVSTNECGLQLTCSKILRSVKPIPTQLQLNNKDSIQRVSPADKLSIKYNLIETEQAPLYLNSPFSSKIKAFIHNDGHIYLLSSNPIHTECINITGVFEDPTELKTYNNCCGCDDSSSQCFDMYETEYPIEADVLDIIRAEIISELLKLKGVKEDNINNSQDDN